MAKASTTDRLRALLDERIVVLDGSWGVLLQGRGITEEAVARRALPRPLARRQGRPRPPQPDAAGGRDRDPPCVLRRRRGHRHDEHVHRDLDRPVRLRARGRGVRDEPRRRTPRARGGGRGGRLRRRLGRPAERLALAVAEGRRRELSLRDVRAGPRRLRRPDPGSGRGRRRPAADRDRLRHAEREGGDRRGGRDGARSAALALVHRDRPERPQPLRADRRRVLALGRARAAADRRRQLLARGRPDAAVRARPRLDRAHVHGVPPERRPPERVRRPRRAAAPTRAATWASSRGTGS